MAQPYKAAFFDADGTLLSFVTHDVPASARRALQELRERGVCTFLCTGRSPSILDDVPIDLFDACITMSGAYCYAGDEAYLARPIEAHDMEVVVEQVLAGLYQCLFMRPDSSFVSGYDDLVRSAFADAKLDVAVQDARLALERDVYQLNAFLSPERNHVVLDATSKLKLSRWSPNFADVMHVDAGKGAGVLATLKRWGIAPDEAVAFGDGGNDAEMFAAVGTSVAMGNASPQVRAMTTHVTDDAEHDGIWNGCCRLGML